MPGLITNSEMNYVLKPWGSELWITNNSLYCGKKLFVKGGHWLSYHHHKIKDEVLYLESGDIWFTFEKDGQPHKVRMSIGQAFHVIPHQRHQIHALVDSVIFEFSTQHFDEDSYRTTRDLIEAQEDNEIH